MAKDNKTFLNKALPIILFAGGVIGVVSSAILMIEKIALLKNPTQPLGCDLNPIIACGSVINTPQASAFGFPNPIIGLIGFSFVAAVGLAVLARASFRRWFWLVIQTGVTFGVGFVTWLQFQSIFRIEALCPYCMVVWIVMIAIFWHVTLYNLREENIKISSRLKKHAEFINKHHADILIGWYLLIAAVILNHFWYYWKTLA